jgi:hypothetical protein
MTRESRWPGLVLFGGVATLLIVWGLIARGLISNSPESIRKNIGKGLPEGALLRDYVKLTDTKDGTYLFIYIDKGYTEEKTAPEAMMSCPGEITGQPIRGRYHLGLFQGNKLVNSVVIPDGNFNLPDYKLAIVHYNIKGNIYHDLNRPDKMEIEELSLLVMKDYTGDGKPYEFLLKTTEGGCGFWDGLVAGYDPETNQAAVFSDWIPNLEPDNTGYYHYIFSCGNHGNEVEVLEDYQYSPAIKRFVKTSEKETPCSG